MTHKYTRRDFEYWLMSIDDYIDNFITDILVQHTDNLDYSLESLDIVEQWLLDRYPHKDKLVSSLVGEDKSLFMHSMCYVGETLRINLGGVWNIHLDESKYRFGKLQVIEKFDDMGSALCPSIIMMTAVEKRTGKFMSGLLRMWLEKSK